MDNRHIESLRSRSRRPSTPGAVLADLLETNSLGITEAAQRLGVSRVTLSRLINDRQALSGDMAHRLGRFFGNGAAIWLRLQQQVDMWDTLHADTKDYEKIEPLAA